MRRDWTRSIIFHGPQELECTTQHRLDWFRARLRLGWLFVVALARGWGGYSWLLLPSFGMAIRGRVCFRLGAKRPRIETPNDRKIVRE